MADEPDHQLHDLPSTEGGTAFVSQTDDLTYPHIPLEASFDSLLNNSYISNTSSQDNMRTAAVQRPPPSLSESWASLSDPELSQDEDVRSEHTDVGSLVDIRSVDDILSVQEEDAATSDEESEDDALPNYDQSDVQHSLHLDQSEQVPTAGTSLTETSLLPLHLTLDEPEVVAVDNVTVRHIHKEFTKAEASSLGFGQAGDHGGLIGTIRTSLSKFSLRDSGRQSLHLLILGKDYVPSLRTSIVGKVADALVASGSSFNTSRPDSPSRYHIVPDCFGPGSMPSAAEVIPIDCQLEVDSYQTAEFVDKTHQTIQLRDSASSKALQSVRHENGYIIDGEKSSMPDVAAILVSGEDSSTDIEEISVMMIFAQRHAIPVLVISVDSGWGGESLPFDDTGLTTHRCVEYVNGDRGPCRRLPLDLDTFLQLDPAQLSRHLAHIVQHPQGRTAEQRISAKSLKQSPANDDLEVKRSSFVNSLPSVQKIKGLWSQVPSWSVAALGAILLLQIFNTFFMGESKMQAVSLSNTAEVTALAQSSDVSMLTHSSMTTTAVATKSTAASTPLTIDATKSVAGNFEVEVVGNSHLVIRTPSKPKKKGRLTFTILKDGKLLDAETTLLFPHVYSVHVPREDMYGNLTVRLEATDSRSTDTVTIDLGQQPLDVWIKNMLEKAESKVVDMAVQFQQEMEKYRQSSEQSGTVRTAQRLQNALLKATRQGEQLIQPLRIKIAQVESRVQAWNERVDARGAELWIVAKATSSDLFIKGKQQVKQMKQASRRLPTVSLRQLPNPLAPLQDAVSSLRNGQRFHRASHMLHGSTQSETLATAQGRAQQIMGIWRRNEGEARRRRGE